MANAFGHTRSLGPSEAKVEDPDTGFWPSQSLGHCDLWEEIASSKALL